MLLDSTHLRPIVSPSPDAARFWAAVQEHRLELPRCAACGTTFFYPRVLCPACGSRDLDWVVASGRGTLYSFCVQYHCAVPGLTDATPFATALVDLDEGPRMMAFLVGVPDEPERISCGIRVEVEFVEVEDGQTVVAFRPGADEPR